MTVPIPSLVSISPVLNEVQFSDDSGNPLAGGLIYTYEAGSNSAQQTTFTTHSGDIANSNPIVLDANGRAQVEIWLADGYAYNLVLTKADGTTVITSYDNIKGTAASLLGGGAGTLFWNPIVQIPIYVSSTMFQLTDDQTSLFAVGNRIRYEFDDLSYGYGTVTNVYYDTGYTQVVFVPDSIGFNNTVINVSWSSAIVVDMIIDAAAVAWTQNLATNYASQTVGGQIQNLYNLVNSNNTTFLTTGTGGNRAINGGAAVDAAFILTPSYGASTYQGGNWNCQFHADSWGANATINISNLGPVSLTQYDANGVQHNPWIKAGTCCKLQFDNVNNQMIVIGAYPVSTPPGTITWFGATPGTELLNIPEGWLYCDGSVRTVAQWPDLFAVIGYTFGGDGSTYFLLPDLRGQFVRGFDFSGSIEPTRTFGSTVPAQIPLHDHGMGYETNDNNGFFLANSPVINYDVSNTNAYINWNGAGHYTGGGSQTWGTKNLNPTSLARNISGDIYPTNISLTPIIKT